MCAFMTEQLKNQVKALPLTPGVYLMKDRYGEIIYIGKAKKLRERVSSYFVKNKQHSSKTLRLIQQLTAFDVIEVESELDALLLECQLIQTHRPIYNRQMNAFDKYKYIEINTKTEKLSINILSVPTKTNCFGPFSINRKLSELKLILENLYGLNQQNYWQHSLLENMPEPLELDIAAKELLGAFTLSNKLPQKRLEVKMKSASDKQSFEKALKLREDWQFLTRFFIQNEKLILANQTTWQLLSVPVDSKKIKYYLIHQGLVISDRTITQRTFTKYTPSELAEKILPKRKPENIQHFSKNQVDFINILYSYINQHKECQLVDLSDPFA